MSMRSAFWIALVAPLLLVACETPGGPDDARITARPHFEIVDGARNGRSDFYFLPPLVPNPGVTGDFDSSYLPLLAVEICEWLGSACGTTVARFTSTGGVGAQVLRIGDDARHYIVNWDTKASTLDPAKAYRLRILAGTAVMGHADVQVVSSGKELKNVNTDYYIPLLDGRTLPIKFIVLTASGVGTIAGTVSSPTLGPLAGLTVTASPGGSAVTDAQGTFQISSVPVGQVTVSVSQLTNCTQPSSQVVTVSSGTTTQADFSVACAGAGWCGANLDFDSGVLPSGWSVRLTDASQGLADGRFQGRSGQAWLSFSGAPTAGTTEVTVEFDAALFENTWGTGSGIALETGPSFVVGYAVTANFNFGRNNALLGFAQGASPSDNPPSPSTPIKNEILGFTYGTHHHTVRFTDAGASYTISTFGGQLVAQTITDPIAGFSLAAVSRFVVSANAAIGEGPFWIDNLKVTCR